jgi:hypothetical protein
MSSHRKTSLRGGTAGAVLILAFSIWWFTRRSPELPPPALATVETDIPRRDRNEAAHSPAVAEFKASLESLSLPERNARIVAKLMDAEHLRLKSRTEEEREDEFVAVLELNPLSPGELKDLIAIAALAEGKVGESSLPFSVNATADQSLTDFLLDAFFLRPGTGQTTIRLHFYKQHADKISYDTSTTFPGTRTRRIGGGSREPLVAGWRFDRFFEPIGTPASRNATPLPPKPRQAD